MTADEAIAIGRAAAQRNEGKGLVYSREVINAQVPELGDRVEDAFGEDAAWAFAAGLTLGIELGANSADGSTITQNEEESV